MLGSLQVGLPVSRLTGGGILHRLLLGLLFIGLARVVAPALLGAQLPQWGDAAAE